MKVLVVAFAALFLSARPVRAQSELQELPLPRIELFQVSLLRVAVQNRLPRLILKDSPIPVLPSLQDGPAPCPFGNGKSCAHLGGRTYFSDPAHMTQHDATLAKAVRDPAMLFSLALNLAATVADAEGTQACLRAHTCKEGNPIFGSDPSRARAYGTAVPLVFVAYAAYALAKKKGQGNIALGLLWSSTVAHVYFAAGAYTAAHGGASTNGNAAQRKRYGITIRF
jgi:hypothetical protein